VYIEHGRVVEQGTHDSLMLAGGRYAKLYRLQHQVMLEQFDGVVG
jgi:ABC-type multidrug transport system fused ATPase/permease subunit